MADIKEAIRRLIFEYVSEGAEKVMATQEAVAASTTKTDKASLSLEKAFGSLERRYVETVRHQQDYQKVQEKVNDAVKQNPALQERANVVLAAASEHFDKLALNANKGGIASSFLSKAISAMLGPAGLMGAAMTAVGVAVGYMASKFESASTTIEQALEEQNRLLKEAKNLIDAKTSAEVKASTQSKELTQFQMLQNELDLRIKINKTMEDAANLAKSRATTPTQVPGEMGEAPTGIAPLAAGAYTEIAAARERLNAAQAAGQPGLVAFTTELAKIGLAYPEMAATINEMIKAGQAGIQLEQAALKAKAISDALAGIATNAQMAAAGLGSIAQFAVSNQTAIDAAAATERQAIATLQIAAAYPGMSIETAKQLYALQQQLPVIQARTGAEAMVKQEIATQNTLLAQGKTLEEAMAIAVAQRANAQAAANKSVDDQIRGLEDSIRLINAYDEDRMKGQLAYERVLRETGDEERAQHVGRLTQEEAEAKRWEGIVAKRYEDERKRAQWEVKQAEARRQANNEAIAAINETNAYLAQQKAIWEEIVAKIGFAAGLMAYFDPASGRVTTRSFGDNTALFTDASGQYTQFNPAKGAYGGTIPGPWGNDAAMRTAAEAQYGPGGFDITGGIPADQRNAAWWSHQPGGGTQVVATSAGKTFQLINTIDGILGRSGSVAEAFNTTLAQVGAGLKEAVAPMQQLIELTPKDQQAGMIQAAIDAVSRQPASLEQQKLLKQLTDKMQGLIGSTDALNATMQDALSPYYSQDPRTTKLGFRAGVTGNPDWLTGATNATALDAILGAGATAPGMAGGGSFIVGGGYSASDNRIAQFPVASGEQVVVNRTPGGQPTVVNNDNRIVINGNLDQDTLSKLKVSRFQQQQRMRGAAA